MSPRNAISRVRVCVFGCVGVWVCWCGTDRASRDIPSIDKISLYLQFLFSILHAHLDAKGVTDKAKFCSIFLFGINEVVTEFKTFDISILF